MCTRIYWVSRYSIQWYVSIFEEEVCAWSLAMLIIINWWVCKCWEFVCFVHLVQRLWCYNVGSHLQFIIAHFAIQTPFIHELISFHPSVVNPNIDKASPAGDIMPLFKIFCRMAFLSLSLMLRDVQWWFIIHSGRAQVKELVPLLRFALCF